MITACHIAAVLQEEDIEGLLNLGAPADEYTPEANRMADAINNLAADQRTEENLSEVVMEVWDQMFGPFEAGDLDKRSPVLRRVVQKLAACLASQWKDCDWESKNQRSCP